MTASDPRSAALAGELGIPGELLAARRLRACAEADPAALVLAERAPDGREHLLQADAAQAWQALKAAAQRAGVTLFIVSAFRSIERQAEIVRCKLGLGQRIGDILSVCAPPGYSEHHGGCAVDLSTPGTPPLEVEFERTLAFDWLMRHGKEFGFYLSYPLGNPWGFQYEPWHWCYRGADAATDKVFWDDPYLCRLDSYVTAADGAQVTLAHTIFYAESGGQESDRGSIGGLPVLAARKDGREIAYTLAEGHGLQPGQRVTVEIDWVRRHRLMRLHFAAEIVLELMLRKVPGVQKIGAHIAQDKARVDFTLERSVAPLFPELKQALAQIVDAARPIASGYSDQRAQRRYWEIEGFARVPCGGTHLRNSSEIGAVELKRKNIGKGKERIEIILAEDLAPA